MVLIMSGFHKQDRYTCIQGTFGSRERRAPGRRGLTLIELVIVIAILTVLGGLIVQTLPNMLKRTHLSKCSDTISSLNRVWGEAYALNMRYPDRYDSLLATGGTTMFTKLSPGLSSLITPVALVADEVKALNKIGVRNVVDLDPTATDVTYDSAPLTAVRRTLVAGGSIASLPLPFAANSNAAWNANPLRLKRHLDLATGDSVKYIVFGIGSNSTAVGAGKLLQEAPVLFVDDDTVNPSTTYQRYLAIFSITTTADGEVSANFEAIAGDGDDCPSSAEDHIREYYESRAKDE